MFYLAQTLNTTITESRSIVQEIGEVAHSVFQLKSIISFAMLLISALILGRVIAAIMRRATKAIGSRADKIEDLATVTRLRRLETLIVLSIATVRTLLVLFAIYLWWTTAHGGQGSTALIGAGAVLTLVLSNALNPVLRDVASGSVMMAEHWYGVGDHIHIEPFAEAQGIVERVTLRSTKIRKFNGEILWINNKDIAGVSIAPKGVRTVVIELFARDLEKGVQLVQDTDLRLPHSPVAVASPLTVMTTSEIGKGLWHITAISEVAPGREWLLDKFAIEVLQELDEKSKILAHDPLSRYADSEAERRYARTINNLRKTHVERDNLVERAEKAARRKVSNISYDKLKAKTHKADKPKRKARETVGSGR